MPCSMNSRKQMMHSSLRMGFCKRRETTMRKNFGFLCFGLAFLFIMSSNAWAVNFGSNITIWDQRGQGLEDQETEPGMINNQSWDLEGFFLDGTTLTMAGGYDFINGNSNLYSGDIFIDIDGNAEFGIGADASVLHHGYDYVIDLDFTDLTFSAYMLTDNTLLADVKYDYNAPESNPWRYLSGGSGITSGDITYDASLSDADLSDYGLMGGFHNAVSVDLAWLFGLGHTDFISHFTMECGNDNLMGYASVPEPDIMVLLGTALVGLSGLGRKFIKRK